MVDTKNKKFGFSLAEALVSMLILSVFFVATSKIISTKPKKELQSNKHGYYECYLDGSVLKQKRSDGNYSGDIQSLTANSPCRFVPPSGNAFVMIYAIADGKFYNSVEVQFNTGENDAEEVVIASNELAKFKDKMETDDGNSDMQMLKNFFKMSYPTSSIYDKLKNSNNYSGPALFICW